MAQTKAKGSPPNPVTALGGAIPVIPKAEVPYEGVWMETHIWGYAPADKRGDISQHSLLCKGERGDCLAVFGQGIKTLRYRYILSCMCMGTYTRR